MRLAADTDLLHNICVLNVCGGGNCDRKGEQMKIYYRAGADRTAEILRCFGTDPEVVLPERIGENTVTSVAAYAFSDRKTDEEEDAFVYETEDHRMFREGERLLAGETVESVIFPETVERIGRYIFYGCRNLRKLGFSDRLKDIGSGAFTGCRSLSCLDVRLTGGRKTCVKEILGELWQRIDVTFYREGKKEAYLVFPEHYEEAVENTPARILFTQHHGSGNNYRQCFYDRETDFRKYDSLFPVAKAQEKISVLTDLVFGRLQYPADLTREAEDGYEQFIREHEKEILDYLVETGDMEKLREISARALWEREALEAAIDRASEKRQGEALSFLMNEKHRFFPGVRKKYEL